MLRTVVIAAAAVLIFIGLALIACGIHASGWRTLSVGLILLIGTLFERWRYRRLEEPAPGGDWQRTEEQFIDPSSGDPVQVMFDPRTGERRYVAGEARGPNDPA